jgi:hypothetical protein
MTRLARARETFQMIMKTVTNKAREGSRVMTTSICPGHPTSLKRSYPD